MSLIRTATSRSYLPACLGIFAILMLFIAPVISRSLEHARVGQSESAGMSDCGMDMSMPMHHEPPPAQTSKVNSHSMPMSMQTGSHNMAMMMDDSACGYCVLLIHVPLLDLAYSPLFWSGSLLSRAPPAHYIFPLFAHVTHAESQPRAPPASLPLI
ncbi:MAG TPA: DUF2946 domain-containing protein [Serratia grimesii]|uniref:DUF2946 domain-containing protein n=1 Tax=Serratia grimesii TaxID=82995 RepID=A0A9C7V8V0_9GAMM|nr:DUF2946 domain-containing protein [Serratia grimesii]KFB90400.1 hypothetical protein CR62_01160 [Serratia grimesii]HCK01667.1 DUF2946 domain-containing protein [Serratia grimesii]